MTKSGSRSLSLLQFADAIKKPLCDPILTNHSRFLQTTRSCNSCACPESSLPFPFSVAAPATPSKRPSKMWRRSSTGRQMVTSNSVSRTNPRCRDAPRVQSQTERHYATLRCLTEGLSTTPTNAVRVSSPRMSNLSSESPNILGTTVWKPRTEPTY